LVDELLTGRNTSALVPSATAAVDDGIRISDSDIVLVGLSVSWENRDAYYIALTDTVTKGLL